MKISLWINSLVIALALSGCSSTPPRFLANAYNNMDPCQEMRPERAEGYQRPSWCGAASNRIYVYSNSGQPQGYLKK